MATKEPTRFAQIALRLPPDASPIFLDELLRVFEKAELDDMLKLQVCSNAFEEHRDYCGKSIADLLGTVEQPLPQEAAAQLQWLTIESPDPPYGHADEPISDEKNSFPRSALDHGFNCTRGRAALALSRLVQRDSAYMDRFASTLEQLAADKSAAVQSCTVYIWRVLATRDYRFAFSMFQQSRALVPSLAAFDRGFQVLWIGLHDHLQLVRPVIEEMFEDNNGEVAAAGARLACISALMHADMQPLAERALRGSDTQRRAAADVAAANIGIAECRARCEAWLRTLFQDADAQVRNAAGECFRHLEDQPLEDFEQLIQEYCQSPAYEANSHALLYTLEQSVEKLPGSVCVACEFFLHRFGREASDMRTFRAADGHLVPRLIFRVYHQHPEDAWTPRALSSIDLLCEHGVGETAAQLQEFDR